MFRLALAGVLALPALLLSVFVLPLQALLSLPSVWLLLWRVDGNKTKSKKRHVIVTGGSSGIGRAIALQAAMAGDKVTILARDTKRLNEAKAYIVDQVQRGNSKTDDKKDVDVTTRSVDVTDYAALERVAQEIFVQPKDDDSTPTTYHLFLCAGQSEPQYFNKLEPESFARQVTLNLLGSTYTARAFLELMVAASSDAKPTLTLCSSMAGQIGVFGFAAYSPTKFALRGLAEVLSMEYHSRLHVQVAYPPDTLTPGLERENLTKPAETFLVSEATAAADPSDIGRHMYQSATSSNPQFHVYFSFDGFLLATLCTGFSPVTTLRDGIAQVSMMQLTRWVSLFYVADWKRILGNHQRKQQSRTRQDGLSAASNEFSSYY
jgi:3-dehydrosphinganine reductase